MRNLISSRVEQIEIEGVPMLPNANPKMISSREEVLPLNRRRFLKNAAMATVPILLPDLGCVAQGEPGKSKQTITVQTQATIGPLPHVWEECVGSDRAVVGLREQWLSDLELVKKATGMKSVRFHGLFNDEMGVLPSGAKLPNFLYVDAVFDAMLERGIKPFVELSFMPGALASGRNSMLWYRGNTTPPEDIAKWGELIHALARHCVDRYGIQEVGNWRFEVWNEPNIVFWSGTQAQYFELYRQSARALKEVDTRLKVGGPSTAQAAWVSAFLDYCSLQQVPIDFVSTHVYSDDSQRRVFGEDRHYPMEEVIPRALTMVREQIKSSKFPELPLLLTEWSSQNPAFIAATIRSCIGLTEMMSYWTFDSVYEELGVPKTFFNKSFGLIGMRGIPRPSFHTFSLLHRLGNTQLASDDGPVLATRREDGSVVVLLWNIIRQDPKVHSSMGDPMVQSESTFIAQGEPREFTLRLQGAHKHGRVKISRVDKEHGDLSHAYQKIGSPEYPTEQQIAEMKRASALPEPEIVILDGNREVTLSIPPNGVALLELM